MTWFCIRRLCIQAAEHASHSRDCANILCHSCPPPRDEAGDLKVWDEETGALHRQVDAPERYPVIVMSHFMSADGQSVRLVAGSSGDHLRVYDPEAGSELHRLEGHTSEMTKLTCIASSSAPPHHPRLVSASCDSTATLWDGETGEKLAVLRGHQDAIRSLAVWKEHTGGHDRIATASDDQTVRVWDGETGKLLRQIQFPCSTLALAFRSAEGPHLLVVGLDNNWGCSLWQPEAGFMTGGYINSGGCPLQNLHVFESAEGRYLLCITGNGHRHPRHRVEVPSAFLDVWDLGEMPPPMEGVSMRPAHKYG
jgi:WD40 repeat protein